MSTTTRTLSKPLATAVAGIVAMAVAFLLAAALAPADQAYAAPAKKQVPRVGSTFVVDDNTYKVTDRWESAREPGEAALVKYGSKNTKPTVNTVKYQGKVYEVEQIGKAAFNTAQGRKITSVKLGRNVDYVGAQAFSGCAKLKTIDIAQSDIIELEYSRRTKSFYVDEMDIGGRAFSNAGVKNVTVKCGSANKSYQNAIKKALTSKGLRTTATVVR